MTNEQQLQARLTQLETQLAQARAEAQQARMPLPATRPELKELVPNASGEWITQQLEQQADLPTALSRYIAALEARLSPGKVQAKAVTVPAPVVTAGDAQPPTFRPGIKPIAPKPVAKITPAAKPTPTPTPAKPVTPAPVVPDYSAMTPSQQASAEWATNAHNCRARFHHADAFMALRTREIIDERRQAA